MGCSLSVAISADADLGVKEPSKMSQSSSIINASFGFTSQSFGVFTYSAGVLYDRHHNLQPQYVRRKKLKVKLNIEALIQELGGAAKTAEIAGVVRTAPYSWIKRRYVSSRVLEKIKEARPDLDLDIYFDEEHHDNKTGCGS